MRAAWERLRELHGGAAASADGEGRIVSEGTGRGALEPDALGTAPDAAGYRREELCALCRVEDVVLVEYVRHGVVVAEDADGTRFAAPALERTLRAVRVQREFEIGVEALALVVDLLERLDAQRREIAVLRGRARAG